MLLMEIELYKYQAIPDVDINNRMNSVSDILKIVFLFINQALQLIASPNR